MSTISSVQQTKMDSDQEEHCGKRQVLAAMVVVSLGKRFIRRFINVWPPCTG
jgi:hypothetical protein